MIAGIQKLWIALYSDLNSAGFHCNGKRVSYSFKTGKTWVELPIARDTSIHEVNDYSVDLKSVVFGMDMVFSNYISKRVVVAYLTSSGDYRSIGFDNSIILNLKYELGSAPGDLSGCQLSFAASSKIKIESINTSILILNPINLGLLYNWFAVSDIRNIAPEGWHVPSLIEIHDLVENQLMLDPLLRGIPFKETGLTHWASPNEFASNEYGFNAIGSGFRGWNGTFYFINEQFNAWLSTLGSIGQATTMPLFYDNANFNYGANDYYQFGLSVRLIKNDSDNTGSVTDIDGNVYPTVSIGNQVWMAKNLAVTRYRNGDSIPEVTGDTEWGEQITGARCAYNNDPLNI